MNGFTCFIAKGGTPDATIRTMEWEAPHANQGSPNKIGFFRAGR
jgi:hypothetical protein